MKYHWFNSLRTQVLLGSILLIVTIFSLVTYNSLRVHNNYALKSTVATITQISETLNLALIPYTTKEGLHNLEPYLNELVDSDGNGVTYLAILDDKKRVLSSSQNIPEQLPDASVSVTAQLQTGTVHVVQPILLEDSSVGHLCYGLSTQILLEANDTLIRENILLMSSGLLLTIALLLLLRYRVGLRLQNLINISNKLASGDYNIRASESGTNEFSLLAHHFNLMADTLIQRNKLLTKKQYELDQAQAVGKIGSWKLDLTDEMYSFSTEAARIFGVEGENHISQDAIFNLIHPQDKEKYLLANEIMLPGNTIDKTFRIKLAGQEKWLHSISEIIFSSDHQPLNIVGIIQDITEIKHSENKVVENKQLLQTSINTIGEAFTIYDPEDRLIFFNSEYKKLYTTTADYIAKGRSFREILEYGCTNKQYPKAVGREQEWIKERLAQHHQNKSEVQQELDDGRWVKIRESKTPDGFLVGFRSDITDIIHARQQAEEASNTKSRFLAVMSHEIRTPLNAVLGISQILEDTPLSSEQKNYLGIITSAGNILLNIINDILDFSRLEAEMVTIESMAFDLQQVCQECINTLKSQAEKKQLDLIINYASSCPRNLMGDPGRIKQVLINLIGNAIKFTHDGQVELSIEQILEEGNAPLIQLKVSDTGIGIDTDKIEHLFDEFIQADQATTRKYGGTGLGLSISQKLVSLMGGNIQVNSKLGEGSQFQVMIPLDEVTTPSKQPDQIIKTSSNSNTIKPVLAKVLLAEDDLLNQFFAKKTLEGFGCEVNPTQDGEEAVEAWKNGSYDLIFMDCRMPVMDGYKATRLIRNLEQSRHLSKNIPIIAVTANSSPEDSQLCYQAGMSDIIIKPYKSEELYKALIEWTEKKQVQKANSE